MSRPARNGPGAAMPVLHRQDGAALFIGLVILLVAALIAISGVRTVVMEKNMATNTQYQMLVFQAAETAIEGTLADDTAFVAAINTPVSGSWPTRSYAVTHTSNRFTVSSTAEISAGTPTVPIGYSIGEFVSYPFTITGDGAIASINAADRHILTAIKVAPYLE